MMVAYEMYVSKVPECFLSSGRGIIMTTQTPEQQENGEFKDARLLDVKTKKIEKKADPLLPAPLSPRKDQHQHLPSNQWLTSPSKA
jgi:hypothetical protein